MKKLLALAPLFLALTACPGPIEPPTAQSVARAVNRAVIAEKAVPLRCPKSQAEKIALRVARDAFDARYWEGMDDEQITVLTEARNGTDKECGL